MARPQRYRLIQERIFYDTNGDFSKHEIWYNQSWQTIDRRNETNGIVINGQWFCLKFDTNGAWTIDSTNSQPSQLSSRN